LQGDFLQALSGAERKDAVALKTKSTFVLIPKERFLDRSFLHSLELATRRERAYAYDRRKIVLDKETDLIEKRRQFMVSLLLYNTVSLEVILDPVPEGRTIEAVMAEKFHKILDDYLAFLWRTQRVSQEIRKCPKLNISQLPVRPLCMPFLVVIDKSDRRGFGLMFGSKVYPHDYDFSDYKQVEVIDCTIGPDD
jgi:hypothetical protein